MLFTSLICPVPPHVGHVLGVVPGLDLDPLQVGHNSLLVIFISFSLMLFYKTASVAEKGRAQPNWGWSS